MEQLIARLFVARSFTHEIHLQTYSHAEHVATQAFYEGIVPLADDLAETYQGATGKPLGPLPGVNQPRADNLASYLRAEANWIAVKRAAIAAGYTPIENQIDEVLALYYQTLDRLRRR